MDAGSLLRHARTKAGLSQRQLARRAGVSQTAISQIEGGKASPRFETLDRLLSVCGFELDLIPRAGVGIDRTTLRELLQLAPAERARIAIAEARNLQKVPLGPPR
jgi:transcriptional regulator with XRE-family HTH domain